MALTANQIAVIEQIATNLKIWADNLSYSPPSPTIITILPYSEHNKVILWLLSEMPAVGQRVEKDFDELYKMHQKVDSWRGKAITKDESDEFQMLVDQIKGVAYDLVATLQQTAQKAGEEKKEARHRKTKRNLYILITGLAALLTCLYLLWWLWTKFRSM